MRNIGISAHIDSGKTTLTERILYYTGRIDEMHEVKGKDQIGATMDSMELERERGITIQSAATYTDWKGCNINIIDTPGHIDFTVEVERALRVLDGAILVVCASGCVQSQTITVDRQLRRNDVPFMTFINKLDRLNADPMRAVAELREKLGHNCAFVQLPMGLERDLKGVIDIVDERALYFRGQDGVDVVQDEVPKDYRAQVRDYRAELVEHVANADDTIGELFLNEETPSVEQLKAAIRRSCIKRTFVPVFVGSALKNVGVQPLLDGVVSYLPNPTEVTNHAYIESKKAVVASDDEVDAELGSAGLFEIHREPVVMDPARNAKKPFVGLAFKIETGRYGQLTYIRAYQGRFKRGEQLVNTRTGKRVRIPRLARMNANDIDDVDDVLAGDICAYFGVECASGDTFVADPTQRLGMEPIYVPEPAISMSIQPKSKKDIEKFSKAMSRYTREDPTLKLDYNEEAGETVISGMGELHLEVLGQRIVREYNCPVTLGEPRVAYRETLSAPIKFDYLHKRQSGGHGQFGRVIGRLEPLPPSHNTKLIFLDKTVGRDVPKPFMPGIDEGFREGCEKGGLTGSRVRGVVFRLLDGASHMVDSCELSFKLAALGAMEYCRDYGQWHIIEPVMSVEVTVPEEYLGAVLGQLQRRSAVIRGSKTRGGWSTIVSDVPLGDMFGYSSELRGATKGKGEFSMEFARYSPCLPQVQQKLVEKYREERQLAESSN